MSVVRTILANRRVELCDYAGKMAACNIYLHDLEGIQQQGNTKFFQSVFVFVPVFIYH